MLRRPTPRIFHPYCLAPVLLLAVTTAGWGRAVRVAMSAPGPAHDGASWETAFTSVPSALSAATAGDEIWVAAGTYSGSVALAEGIPLYGGFAGNETERTRRDWRANVSALDGGGGFVPVVTSAVMGAVLDGFTVRNGGHGISIGNGDLAVSNCTVTGNAQYGIEMSAGSVAIARCVVTRNSWSGVNAFGSSASIANCIVSGNGDGVFVYSNNAAIANCTISGNAGYGIRASGTSAITNCTITGQPASGVYLIDGSAVVRNCVVAFNSAGVTRSSTRIVATVRYNDVFGNAAADYVGLPDPTGSSGNVNQDPLLSNVYHDVHIQPASPCVNAGETIAASYGWTDVDGHARVFGGRVDIGSDESEGTVWTVPSRIWFVSQAGDDNGDGKSWAGAKKTIAGCLSVAQPSDEVWVAAGTYTENPVIPPVVALYGGFAGGETSRDQRNCGLYVTTLVGQDHTAVTAPFLLGRLDGFTVQGGVSLSGGGAICADCAISNGVYVGTLTAGRVTVADCSISGSATGIRIEGPTTLSDCVISGNTTDGVNVSSGEALITRCAIDGNKNGISTGGGVANVTDCTISGNRVGVNSTSGTAILTRCTISNSSNQGVYVYGGTATCTDCLLSGNVSDGVCVEIGSVTLANCTIRGSKKGLNYGRFYSYASWASITNSLFVSNETAILQYESNNVPTLSHTNVYGSSLANYSGLPDPTGTNGNISAAPMFVDEAGGDYRLTADSPCRDTGTDAAVAQGDRDLDSKPRIIGAHVDMGAFEFGANFLTVADAAKALRLAAGLEPAPGDVSRWNVAASTAGVDMMDAARIARMAAAFEPNP